MKRLIGRAVPFVTITALIFSAVSAFAVTDKPSPVPPPEMKVKKAEASLDSSSLSGKVLETMNSGGYTYVLLEKKGKKTWAAIPEMKVSVGQQMSLQPGTEMANFPSKSLGRTFDSIIFSGGPLSDAPSASGKEKADKKTEVSKTVSPPAQDIKVAKATGPDAYTIGEIFEKRTALHEKTAVVKGKVVKISAGIMGKNWIHLQDGTGDPKQGTNDLVATSDALPALGDVITVRGTVFKDKDFGSGYKYSVIMEKASIQR
ncbi:MAG: DNA-binding protein [Nitrospirae bacterium]|nr:DNA-binding protein [Nitrospirota bacterium]